MRHRSRYYLPGSARRHREQVIECIFLTESRTDMTETQITRENAGDLLLLAIAAELREAEKWLDSLPDWKRQHLQSGRYFNADRRAEAGGWVRFQPSSWLVPTRAQQNYLSTAIRDLEQRGLVGCERSQSRIIYVKLTGRGTLRVQELESEALNG